MRESAGGAVGWLLGQPLYAGVTAAPAVILLTLLAIFGLLLLTGTAIRDVPAAVAGGVDWIRGDRGTDPEFVDDDDRSADEFDPAADYRAGGQVQLDEDVDLAATARLRRPSKRRQAADAAAAARPSSTPTEPP